ncbi:MAG: hypothetical protein FWD13_13490 [Treponema sp.]|nr:hypothetical protein [Treponema sp.]
MKKAIITGLILLVITMFAACANKDNIPSDVCLSSNGGQAAPNVQYIRIGSGFGPMNPICTVISSVNELEIYTGSFDKNLFWEAGYADAIAKYTDNYFTDNFLVIVLLEENSGSNRHEVEKVETNGDIIINRLIPEIGTADMATWNIIIELNNNFKPEHFQVILK